MAKQVSKKSTAKKVTPSTFQPTKVSLIVSTGAVLSLTFLAFIVYYA